MGGSGGEGVVAEGEVQLDGVDRALGHQPGSGCRPRPEHLLQGEVLVEEDGHDGVPLQGAGHELEVVAVEQAGISPGEDAEVVAEVEGCSGHRDERVVLAAADELEVEVEVEVDDESAVDEVTQGGEASGIRPTVGELDGDVRDGAEVVRDVERAGVVGSRSRTIAPGSGFLCTPFG